MKDNDPLERTIEKAVTKYAKERGAMHRKLNGLGYVSWPDQLFIYRDRILLIEFKRLGHIPTPLQAHLHKELGDQGFKVYVVDNTPFGKALIDRWMAGEL